MLGTVESIDFAREEDVPVGHMLVPVLSLSSSPGIRLRMMIHMYRLAMVLLVLVLHYCWQQLAAVPQSATCRGLTDFPLIEESQASRAASHKQDKWQCRSPRPSTTISSNACSRSQELEERASHTERFLHPLTFPL